jgi:hypothetical protein
VRELLADTDPIAGGATAHVAVGFDPRDGAVESPPPQDYVVAATHQFNATGSRLASDARCGGRWRVANVAIA